MGDYGTANAEDTGAIQWPYELPVPLFGRTHKFTARGEATEMASEWVRWRRLQDDPIETIAVQWNFTNDQYARFELFFNDTLKNGEKVFTLETYDQSSEEHMITIVTRVVAFLGVYKGNRDGNLHSVTATLVVESTDIYDVENWFDPFPPTPESLLPENPPTFDSACRDEFTLTYGPEYNLQADVIYGVEISDTAGGPFVPHIYFALQTSEEIASRTKVLRVNNDYNGNAWFRMVQVSGGYAILTSPTNPQASVLPAPIITISNLSEITTQEMIQLLGGAATGCVPLWGDDTGSENFFTPLSFVEDKMIWLSEVYRRASKKYAQRQGWNNSNDRFGDLIQEKTAGVNIITVENLPAGASFTFTRDQSDPAIDTFMPRLQSLANNVQAQDHRFQGVVKVRFFKDGCKSPLCTVLIDKLMHEIPTIEVQVGNNGVNGYCDLTLTDSVTGLPSESGNSCIVLWGGKCNFESHIVGIGWAGGSTAIARWSPDTALTALRRHVKTWSESVYLGWPIHAVGASYYDFSAFNWFNKTFNGWHLAPKTHNWAITNTPALNMYPIGWDESVCGTDGDATASADTFMAVCSFDVGQAMPDPPSVGCLETIDLMLTYSRFDIIRATQWKENPRDTFWFESDDPFEPPVPTLEPQPDPPSPWPYDDFESYLDGNALVMTLDFDAGADWSGAWAVRNGTATTNGYDTWENYTAGAKPDYDGVDHTYDPTYEYLNKGEGWEEGSEWRFVTGYFGIVGYDTWETYSNGDPAFASLTGGYYWEPGSYWRTDLDTEIGKETWETYADGAFVGANTGTIMIAEAWQSR
jgi:hypothetical protein